MMKSSCLRFGSPETGSFSVSSKSSVVDSYDHGPTRSSRSAACRRAAPLNAQPAPGVELDSPDTITPDEGP